MPRLKVLNGLLGCVLILVVVLSLMSVLSLLALVFLFEILAMVGLWVNVHYRFVNASVLQETAPFVLRNLFILMGAFLTGFVLVLLSILFIRDLSAEAVKILASLLCFCVFGLVTISCGYGFLKFPDDKELIRLRTLGASINPKIRAGRLVYLGTCFLLLVVLIVVMVVPA